MLAAAVQAKPFAVFQTSEGNFTVELFSDKAPVTVENFIGLATGKKTWQHPATRKQMSGKPLYDGTIFHRTIPKYMIQGGDPLGTGGGDPGYRFADEQNGLKFDEPGLLAMANSGKDTNGSQFFVTVAQVSHLNNPAVPRPSYHTIFGKVVAGMEVVNKISEMPTRGDRPVNPVKLIKVEIKDSQEGGPAKTDSGATATKQPAGGDKSTTGGAVSGKQ